MTTTTEPAADADDAGSSGSDAELPPEPGAEPDALAASIDIDVIRSETAVGPAVAGVDPEKLGRRLAAAVGHLDHAVRRISVLIVDDPSMASLHERHAGVAGPTDVLTFPGSAPGEPIDVDIAVNADEAARQSVSRCHDTDDEVLLYALHGVLHCAGFDDHEAADYDAMHAEEDRILAEIGVGATFRAAAAPARRNPPGAYEGDGRGAPA